MKIIKIFLTCSTCLLFSACAPKPIEVNTTVVEKTKLDMKDPKPIKMNDVEFFIITKDNATEIFKELEAKNVDVVLYGLSDNGYENMSINMANIKRYILEQRQIINSYRNYYEGK